MNIDVHNPAPVNKRADPVQQVVRSLLSTSERKRMRIAGRAGVIIRALSIRSLKERMTRLAIGMVVLSSSSDGGGPGVGWMAGKTM